MTLAILAVFSVALTLLGFVLPPQGVKRATLLGLALALASLLLTWGKPFAFGPYAVDGISQVFTLLALLGALWTVGLVRSGRFEFYLLVLYAALGMHLLASTRHLLLMLVALEALSLPLYALATWRRGQGLEAALKYFLLGALAAASTGRPSSTGPRGASSWAPPGKAPSTPWPWACSSWAWALRRPSPPSTSGPPTSTREAPPPWPASWPPR